VAGYFVIAVLQLSTKYASEKKCKNRLMFGEEMDNEKVGRFFIETL